MGLYSTDQYQISRNQTVVMTIDAGSPEHAATQALPRMAPGATRARRTTGQRGKSGYFQGYEVVPARLGGGLNSVGEPFHVGPA